MNDEVARGIPAEIHPTSVRRSNAGKKRQGQRVAGSGFARSIVRRAISQLDRAGIMTVGLGPFDLEEPPMNAPRQPNRPAA